MGQGKGELLPIEQKTLENRDSFYSYATKKQVLFTQEDRSCKTFPQWCDKNAGGETAEA